MIVTTLLGLSTACADVVSDWNARAFMTIMAAKQGPPVAARSMAIVHTAMFEAGNAIERRYTPYKVKVQAPAGASSAAAMVAAAYTTLVTLYPDQKTALERAYTASLGDIAESEGKMAGVALGERVAAALLALRSADGTGTPNTYKPRTIPGIYVPTVFPVAFEQPGVTPWLLESAAQFHPAPPPALQSLTWARDYQEVQELGAKSSTKRTEEQTEVARFWIMTGPASWNPVVQQVAAAHRLDLLAQARLHALVNMAATDAHIAVFEAKYTYQFWRPITAIRNGDTDGNEATVPDLAWTSLIEAPLHPEYPCAHCIVTSTVATILEAECGTESSGPLTMTSPTAPGITRQWESLRAYAEEVAHARLWGGIHYRTSTEVGQEMGRKIGAFAVEHYLKALY
jgi:hypothetical protein